MSNKKINYTNRDYEAIKSELIGFSKKYYPEITDDFNDASVGSWLLDLVSVVGDNLNYHIDRTYAENNVNTASLKGSVYNNARKNGVKIPGPKASMCEVELSCTLPLDSTNISIPNFNVAPIIKMGSVVGNSSYKYELIEDVDFRTQFNSEGVSNRTFSPLRNSNGVITAYTVTKTTMVVGGTSKIFKKVLSDTEVVPFMEIVLPEKNIMSVESIIFKESSNFNGEPLSYEYYIDDEKFFIPNETIETYRYFETNSLSDQFRFGTKVNYQGDKKIIPYEIESYEDYTETVIIGECSSCNFIGEVNKKIEYICPDCNSSDITIIKEDYTENVIIGKCSNCDFNGEVNKKVKYLCPVCDASGDDITIIKEELSSQKTTRYYRGEWKPITQKFITEYTDNGYLKIIFGCGTDNAILANQTEFGKHMMSKMINNKLLGVLPKAGWTMFVLYRTNGGTETNLAQGSITSIISANIAFVNVSDNTLKSSITSSLNVNNISPSIGGKDMPSVSEIKYLTKYSIPSQERCVTIKDYKERILQIPPKYGCPFRLNAMEDNNKIIISCLGLNSNGKLDDGLPSLMVENMSEYLSHYKTLGDYIEFRSGKIYNLGFGIDIFVDKNYDPSIVVKNVINFVKEYMSVKNHDMGEDIFIGDLEKEINNIDGVISLIDLRIYAIYNGSYSTSIPSLPKKYEMANGCSIPNVSRFDVSGGAESFEVDLNGIDYVLYSDVDSMYEILNDNDIKIQVKLR